MVVIDITRRLLEDAGIARGARVLDLGCGYGDVAALAAERIGPEGEVVAVDRDASHLGVAAERLAARGLHRVRLVRADLDALPEDLGDFDAVVGRRVLMYLPRPLATLRAAVARLRPGGVLVAQEHDGTGARGSAGPAWTEHARLQAIVWDMVRREGADPGLARRLGSLLAEAGLEVEHVRADAILTGPDGTWQGHAPLASVVRAVAPRILATGAATEADLGLADLEARLAAERAAADHVWAGELAFGAWGRRR